MRLRLWHRLFLAFAVLSGATLVGFVTWQQWSFREGFSNYLNAVSQQRLQAASERLAEAYREHGSWDFLRGNEAAFEQALDPLGARRGSRAADPDAAPRDAPPPPADGPPPDDAAGLEPAPPHDLDAHPSREDRPPFRGRPPGGPGGFEFRSHVLLADAADVPIVGGNRIAPDSITVPVEVNNKVVGLLHLSPLPRVFGGLDLTFASAQRHGAMLAGGVALLAALLLAFAVARWLLAPVRALTSGMNALTAGDFAQRVTATSSDELGALGRDFNHLAQTLEQHRDARRRWGADIAHELRTPLSILQGEVAALQDGVRAATPAAFDSLQIECARLSGLIEDLYQLSLADAGALEYRFETLDLVELVSETLALQQRACNSAGLTLEWIPPDQTLSIRGDARRLAQLIENLLGNARRYTDAQGKIRATIACGNAQVRLTFDDTPPGVPDAALPHLFERLYRVEASRNRAAGGAGLGLAICRAIVQAHDGSISASPSPLGGLRITIDFPLLRETLA
jgi:two-component system, OmpR family, sensor histidine kinase BaeS